MFKLLVFIILLFLNECFCQTYNVLTYANAQGPHGICFSSETGDLVYSNLEAGLISKVSPTGTLTTIASGLTLIGTVACDSKGIAYSGYGSVLKSYYGGTTAVLAGTGVGGPLDGKGTAAQIYDARMAVDSVNRNIYFGASSKVRRMNLDTREIRTSLGFQFSVNNGFGFNQAASSSGIVDIDVDPGTETVYYTQDNSILKMNSSGYMSFIAGRIATGSADGIGSNAAFNGIAEIVFDSRTGNVYITDRYNNAVRMINPSTGQVSTIATGFNQPIGLGIDQYGDLYVGDYYNSLIKKIAVCQPGGTFDATSKYCKYTSCGPGYQLTTATGRCDKCSDGKYKSTSGASVCLDCLVGQKSLYDRTACQSCPSGQYLNPAFICTNCPLNSNCSSVGWSCPSNFKYNNVTNICESCPPNQVYSTTLNACVNCSSNQYFRSNCVACPVNATCDSINFNCAAGFTLSTDLTSCSACPLGTFKNTSGNAACSNCPVGTQSSTDLKSCDVCQAGKYRPDLIGNRCFSCPPYANCSTVALLGCQAGYKLNLAGDGCEPCPIGTQSSVDFMTCISCSLGFTFRSSLSQSTCLTCPSNSVCSSVSAFTCNAGFELTLDGQGCSQCVEGYFKESSGNVVCTQCGLGSESASNKQSCSACLSGKYRPSNTYNKCITCPPNGVCSSSALTRCLNGWQINAMGDGCEQCPIGQDGDGTNCVPCVGGYFKPSQAYNTCLTCPSNSASCSYSSIACQTGYYFDTNVQCKRNDSFFGTLTTTTQSASTFVSSISFYATETVTAPPLTLTSTALNFITVSNTISATGTATIMVRETISISGPKESSPAQQQAQSANSVTIDFVGTLPISPLILAAACIGFGAFVMLVISLVCCRRSPMKRKDEEFDGAGMTSTMNTTSQRTFTNSSVAR